MGGTPMEPGGRELAGEHPEDSWPGTENTLETDSSLRGGVLGGEGAFPGPGQASQASGQIG